MCERTHSDSARFVGVLDGGCTQRFSVQRARAARRARARGAGGACADPAPYSRDRRRGPTRGPARAAHASQSARSLSLSLLRPKHQASQARATDLPPTLIQQQHQFLRPQQLSRAVGTVAPEPHLEARAPALRHRQRCVVVLAAAREEHEPTSPRLDQRACREPRVATLACHLVRVGVGVDVSPG